MKNGFYFFLLVALLGCSSGSSSDDEDTKPPVDTMTPEDTPLATDLSTDTPTDTIPAGNQPVEDPEAAARAFKLYYRERVERVAVSYNRFMLFGDVGFGTNIGKAGVARTGNEWEIAVGPNDNNHIGESIWHLWYGYRVFRSRTLALSLVRMFEGLVFYEAVSGHPGVTSRMAYPGWTLVLDGLGGRQRLRGGTEVESPLGIDPDLEAEIYAAFFDGFNATYRMEGDDLLLNYMPTKEMGPYAVTYSFSMLPDYLRVSDCCTSLKRTPAPYDWEGAFWGNHNSRDNFPDLSMGYLAARAAMDDPDADPEVRAAAQRAWAAGQRIGDLVQENDGCLMTVDEHNPYDTLVVAGTIRPDGETEAEDLGSLSDCQMVFLARALSSDGLTVPLPELPAPGSLEPLVSDFLGGDQCPIPEPVRMCNGLGEAYCGKDWTNIGELTLLGKPWLEAVEELEAQNPGAAENLIGSFQDDFHEKNIALLGLVFYARTVGDEALLEATLQAQAELTDLMRYFGELMYARTKPDSLADKLYKAALFDARAGRPVALAELNDFSRAEWQMSRMEDMLVIPDTQPAALITDDEIKSIIESRLAGSSESVKARYEEIYGDELPLRRTDTGYEARHHHPNTGVSEWQPVVTAHHQNLGGVELFEALPICETSPDLLDCTWAALGCRRPDLNGDGKVDEADLALFEGRSGDSVACDEDNDWCQGADLDRTGVVDAVDEAFMSAAQGCWY